MTPSSRHRAFICSPDLERICILANWLAGSRSPNITYSTWSSHISFLLLLYRPDTSVHALNFQVRCIHYSHIFPAWLMGACDFCLSCSGCLGDKFFSLSLMLFGGQIGVLCNSCIVGDFALLGVVCVRVVDCTCVFVKTTTLDLSPFPTCCWAGAW